MHTIGLGEVLEKRGHLRLQKEALGSILCCLIIRNTHENSGLQRVKERSELTVVQFYLCIKQLNVANQFKKYNLETGTNSKYQP